ncbi:NUDIX domain-containing protein [Lyngbya aestuarii]|uniref:NUDIX domain-containing protein n=1 Tax=Lyngbya aestuarii TaxID=118322 RepID=UPI00403D7A90
MIDETWYKYTPGIEKETSAGGVVARLENEQMYIALIKENRRSGYVLPKGRVEAGESIEQAACREIEEEAGFVNLQLIAPLGVRERLAFSKRTWKKTYYFLFITDQVEGIPTDPLHDQPQWFSLEQLPELFWPEQKELIETNRDQISKLINKSLSTSA